MAIVSMENLPKIKHFWSEGNVFQRSHACPQLDYLDVKTFQGTATGEVFYNFVQTHHRANPRSSLRPIARFVVEIQRFVCDRATPPIIEKLRSKGVAMHAEGVSAYYA